MADKEKDFVEEEEVKKPVQEGITVETKEADADNSLTVEAPYDDDLLEDSERAILEEKPAESVADEVTEEPKAEAEPAVKEEAVTEPVEEVVAEAEPEAPVSEAPEEVKPLFTEIEDTTTLLEFKPKYNAEMIIRDRQELEKQYEAGDIEDSKYIKQSAFFDKMLLEDEIRKETIDAHNKAVIESAEKSWLADQQRFYNKPENQGIFEDNDTFAAMCSAINRLSPQFRGRTNIELLEAAKSELVKKFIVNNPKVTPISQAKKETPMPAPPAGKKPVIPVTLGGVPPAKSSDMGNKFAHLKSLKGEDLEREIDRMSESQFEEYLRAGN